MNDVTELRPTYIPSPKQCIFHESRAKYKILRGAYGSSKTRMAVEEVNTLVAEYDGIIIYVMRKTLPALRDSTLHEFTKYMPDELGHYNKKTEQFNALNRSEVRFRGLDDPAKMRGPEPAVIVMDEADEFTLEDFKTLKARIRQMRKTGESGKPYPHHIILLFNPVDELHWIYTEFVGNAAAYEKTGGLLVLGLSTYDNIKNLPEGYIEQVTAGLTPDEIDRYINGNWGAIVKGKPVFSGVFSGDLHIRKWDYRPGIHSLVRGWDFGFNRPAVSFRLKDVLGRKNIDFEMLGDKEHLDVFARRVLEATRLRYGDIKVIDYCDPRGHDRNQNSTLDQENAVQILNELGIFATGERGIREYVEPGIQVVRKELSTLIEGMPELTINPDCGITRAAFGGRYVRGDDGKPIKDGYYEHIMDANRYAAYMDRTNSSVKTAILQRQSKNYERKVNSRTGYSSSVRNR